MHGFVQSLHKQLELRHPTDWQVTVLKQHPVSFWCWNFHQRLRFFTLSLTQRNRFVPFWHVWLLSEFQEVSYWIGTWWKNENQWSNGWRVSVAFSKIKSGSNNEFLAHGHAHIVLNGRNDFIRSNGLDNDDFLELIKIWIEWFREVHLLRTGTVKKHFPLISMLHHMLIDSLHNIKLPSSVELPVEIRPLVLRNPSSWVCRNMDLSWRPRKQIPPFFRIYLSITLLNLYRQNEWEQQFMLFEQWSAHILVKWVSKVVVHVFKSLF